MRDTLKSKVSVDGFKATQYQKISHEGGHYAKDVIDYSYVGKNVYGASTKHRIKDGKPITKKVNLSGTGPVYDMLSIFYYLRMIDYSTLRHGVPFVATVFSGSKAETVTIKSLGLAKIKINKQEREAYHIQFKFTTAGRKKSSDDIDAWLSADDNHIPLKLIGKLPVGRVEVMLKP